MSLSRSVSLFEDLRCSAYGIWCLKVGDTFYKARRVIHKKFKTLPLPQISKHETTTIIIYSFICDVLRNLVPLAQFKKREKHPWRSATFISLLKVRLLRGCFPRFLNFKNCTKSRNGLHILYSSTTSNFHCFTVCILLPYSF